MVNGESIESMSLRVITKIANIPELQHLPIHDLESIPLGRLRKNATRLHAVCRYKRGVIKSNGVSPSDVRCIDIHPYALVEKWSRYTEFLLYHEYLHALGFSNHGRAFRNVESLWPDKKAQAMGNDFSRYLIEKSSKWLWTCISCDIRYPRSRRSNGRYRCRTCKNTLVDVMSS